MAGVTFETSQIPPPCAADSASAEHSSIASPPMPLHTAPRDWRTAPAGTAPLRHLELPPADEAARHEAAPSVPGHCVDELCACSLHKCIAPRQTIPFDADTTYRTQYKYKEVPRPQPAPPAPLPATLPFDADTSYRTQFKAWETPTREAAPAVVYSSAKDSRDFATETRSQFGHKEIPRHATAPPLPPIHQLPFEATTTYRTQFTSKEVPRAQAAPAVPVPTSLPFDATTHYRETFLAHPVAKQAQLPTVPYSAARDNRDFTTAYRGDYKGAMPSVCPVARLPAYPVPQHPRIHTFWDPAAKKWY